MNLPDDPGVDDILLRRPDQVFVQNWRLILKRAWSVRLILLAALLSGLEVMLPLIGYRLPISEWAQAVLLLLITAGAFVARFVAQDKIRK